MNVHFGSIQVDLAYRYLFFEQIENPEVYFQFFGADERILVMVFQVKVDQIGFIEESYLNPIDRYFCVQRFGKDSGEALGDVSLNRWKAQGNHQPDYQDSEY
jgi:hypothetical protein